MKVFSIEIAKRQYDSKFMVWIETIDRKYNLREFQERQLPLPLHWILAQVCNTEEEAINYITENSHAKRISRK